MPIKLSSIKILVPFGLAALALGACTTYPTLPDRYAQAYDQCDQNAGICYTSCQSYSVEQGRLECQSDCSASADQCFADVSAWAERESQYRAQQSFAFYGQYGAWYPHRGYYYGPHRRPYTYAPWRQPGYSSGYGYGGGGYYGSGGGHPSHPPHPDHPTQPDRPSDDTSPRVSDPKPDYGVGGRDRPRLPESELDLNPQVGGNVKSAPPRPQPPATQPRSTPKPTPRPPVTQPRPTPKPIPQKQPTPKPQPSRSQNPKSDRNYQQEK